MRYCSMGNCQVKAEEYGRRCCKDCYEQNDCYYACDGCKDERTCAFEIEDKNESHFLVKKD